MPNYLLNLNDMDCTLPIGLDDNMQFLIQTLLKYQQNNPIIIGNEGVGKTALIQGIIYQMNKKEVPEKLKNKQIVQIDIMAILVKEENPLQCMKTIIQNLMENKEKYILYINDIGLLKEAISLNLQCIIECLTPSFLEIIEPDFELMKYLQVIKVNEPSAEIAMQILEAKKHILEKHYSIEIPSIACEMACHLAFRYIQEKSFPLKAWHILDVAASLSQEKVLNPDLCKKVIVIEKGIPIDKIDMNDKERLVNIENILHQRVIGQNEAIHAVANAIKRAYSGLQEQNRPFGSFLFIGSTGVGKTELAKTVAEFVFHDERKILRLDMSEFMEKNSITRMIGAPPGTEGFAQGGLLTESVRQNPFQVILFDEIEKAHLDVLNLLLQVLDEGRLTDSKGTLVDFKNTIMILTSNVAADMPSYQRKEALAHYFKLEFLNRLDEIVSFHQLTEDDLFKIVELNLTRYINRLNEKGYSLTITENAKKWFVDEVYTSKFGVRALKRLIQEQIENPICTMILEDTILTSSEVLVDVDGKTGQKLAVYAKKKAQ